MLEISPGNVALVTLKGAEDGEGRVLRLLETAGRDAEGNVTFPRIRIVSAREASAVEVPGRLLDHDEHSVRFRLGPHQALTIRVATQ